MEIRCLHFGILKGIILHDRYFLELFEEQKLKADYIILAYLISDFQNL